MYRKVTLAVDVQAAIGGRHQRTHGRLLFASYHGHVSAVTLPTVDRPAQLHRLGSGYNNPEDVLVARHPVSGNEVVYVSDRVGTIYQIDPAVGFHRSQATVLVSGLTAPQQMALSNDGESLYVVEYTPPERGAGRVLQVALRGGGHSVLLTDVRGGVGLLSGPRIAGSDSLYLAEQAFGTVTHVDVASKSRAKSLVSGLPAPFFLSWLDAARMQFMFTVRDPANRLITVNLTKYDAQGNPLVERLIDDLPWRPSSAIKLDTGHVVVFCDREIVAYDLNTRHTGRMTSMVATPIPGATDTYSGVAAS
jgi:hypothetical protein